MERPEIVVDSSASEAPKLLCPMLEKEQADPDAQHAQQVRRPPGGLWLGTHIRSFRGCYSIPNCSPAMKHAVPNTNVDKGVCSYDQTQVFKINGLVTLPFDESALVKGWQISGILAANSGLRMNIQDGYDDEAAGGTHVALTPRPDYMPGCQVQVGKVNEVNELYNQQCFTLETPGTRRRQLVRGRWAKRSGRKDPDFFRAPAPDPVCIEVSVLIYTDLGAEDDPGELGTAGGTGFGVFDGGFGSSEGCLRTPRGEAANLRCGRSQGRPGYHRLRHSLRSNHRPPEQATGLSRPCTTV